MLKRRKPFIDLSHACCCDTKSIFLTPKRFTAGSGHDRLMVSGLELGWAGMRQVI
jgi:hypothetical protein